jgi:hypothetical protein
MCRQNDCKKFQKSSKENWKVEEESWVRELVWLSFAAF